ncbi:outer membrane beta-barrel protein [candidate division KSB1 bacterium]|nr:outer membrane beta-barrel protein [candidate division KSB1 bacterium]
MNKLAIVVVVSSMAVTYSASAADWPDWLGGPHLVFSIPQQDFANVSGLGEGFGGKLLYDLTGRDYFHLRADLAYLSYGEGDQSSYGLTTYTTRNESLQLTLGPQLTYSLRAFHFYFAPTAGVFNYRSVQSIYDYYWGVGGSKTTFSQTKLGWEISGGFHVDIRIGPHLDLGFKYQRIPNAVKSEFMQEGRTVTIQSDATAFAITLGVLFFIR